MINDADEYTLEYITEDEFTSTTPGLTLLGLIHNLLYLAANNVLDYGDVLYIYDHEDNHVYNFLNDVNDYVEFQVTTNGETFQVDYEGALNYLHTPLRSVLLENRTLQYRRKGTDTWETFTNG